MKRARLPFRVWILAAVAIAASAAARPPDAAFEATLAEELGAPDVSSSDFEYSSAQIEIRGRIEADASSGAIRLWGVYSTSQDIAPDSLLAFHVLDADGKLRLLDGRRTPWEREEGRLTARFDYRYSRSDLGLRPAETTFALQFDYVQELEFWYGDRFPELELPALRVRRLPRETELRPWLSWTPSILPAGATAWTFHVIRIAGDPGRTTPYKASMEGFLGDPPRRHDNKRRALPSVDDDGSTLAAAWLPLELPRPGVAQRRLGFVWEGKRWLELGPDDRLRASLVAPLWLYATLAAAAGCALAAGLRGAARIGRARLRLACRAALAAGLALWALEFASDLLPFVATLVAGAAALALPVSRQGKIYAALLLFALGQELLWTLPFSATTHNLESTWASFFLASLVFAPVVCLERRWAARAVGIAATVALTAFYLVMRLYVDFFGDFPTLDVLTYAGQAVEVADSVPHLYEPSHALALIACAWTIAVILGARDSRPTESISETKPAAKV